jgi:hypothetical protein
MLLRGLRLVLGCLKLFVLGCLVYFGVVSEQRFSKAADNLAYTALRFWAAFGPMSNRQSWLIRSHSKQQ